MRSSNSSPETLKKVIRYSRRNAGKPLRYHLTVAKRLVGDSLSKHRALAGISISDQDLRAALNRPQMPPMQIAQYFKNRTSPRFFIDVEERDSYSAKADKLFPESVEWTCNQATEICHHNFDLLGSGPTALGQTIDWNRDFKSGYIWPRIYHKEIHCKDYTKGYDVKVPRELSRFQHLVVLGKAYWYTGNETFASEFVHQVDHWIEENPPSIGVNWQCTMDVAIRIVNWIWGFYFFKDAKAVNNDFVIRFLKSCLVHGRHISSNLEWSENGTSNHYLSDLVGLLFLGLTFPEFKESNHWLELGTAELLNELEKQIYDDGMDYEASTAYHRLVLELYYSSMLLSRLNGREWPRQTCERIHRMFSFVKGIIKPDGFIPQMGDNDSGRLQILAHQEDLAGSYLLPIGALLFNDRSFKLKGVRFPEEAFWLFGPDSAESYALMTAGEDIQNLPSCHFENSGLYVIRSKRNYLISMCGSNGQNGNGGHAHNDKLSFELQIRGRDVIVDPGTYLYSGDCHKRNLFRSTHYHNTVVVDGQEINHFDPAKLFQLKDSSRTENVIFSRKGDKQEFIGKHEGYLRLEPPVIHERHIIHDETTECWAIHDSLAGPSQSPHDLKLYFHFAPKCFVERTGEDISRATGTLEEYFGAIIPSNSCVIYRLQIDHVVIKIVVGASTSLRVSLEKGWVSPAYGVKKEAPVLVASCRAPCPVSFFSLIFPGK